MPGRRCRTAAPVSLLNPDPGGIFEVLNTSIPWAAFFDSAPGRGGESAKDHLQIRANVYISSPTGSTKRDK